MLTRACLCIEVDCTEHTATELSWAKPNQTQIHTQSSVCASKDYKLCLKLFICFSTEKKLQHRIRTRCFFLLSFDFFFFFFCCVADCKVWWCLSVCHHQTTIRLHTKRWWFVCSFYVYVVCVRAQCVCALCFCTLCVDLWNRRAIPAAHCTKICATYVRFSLACSLSLSLSDCFARCSAFGCGRINCYLVNWLVLTLQ